MLHSRQRRQNLTQGIFSLWANWAISVGFILLPIIIAPLVSPRTLPLILLALVVIHTIIDRRIHALPYPTCFRVPHLTQIILIASSVIVLIDIIYTSQTDLNFFACQIGNNTNSIFPILDIAPIATVICLINISRKNNARSCRSCSKHFGEAIDRGVIGMLYNRESKKQIKILFWMSLILATITWGYFFFLRENIQLKNADTFFFIISPILLYVISLIYFGMRYYSLSVYYCHNKTTAKAIECHGTTVRFLVICDDKILLTAPAQTEVKGIYSDENKLDVPLKISLSFKEYISDIEARHYFNNAFNIKDADIRLLFTSCDPGMYNNLFHFVVFINDTNLINGQWNTLPEINNMIKDGAVSMSLAAELSRIYTITMAWKAYDNKGHRLYEIKHYKPTFRLKDMPTWDVDYNDANWLNVAEINEDKPFYRIRRMWRKLTEGFGE